METKQIKFQFKGSRQYVQGPDIFNAMLTAYSSEKNLSNIRFSVHGFVYNPLCRLYLTNSKEESNTIADARARCQFSENDNTQWLVLTESDEKNVAVERSEYDEKPIISSCKIENNCIILLQKSPYTFIETLVSMNKYLHQQLFPEIVGKWIFTRIDLDANCDEREHLSLQFMHNMNYRLTKTDVLVNGKKIGDIFFSLVKS